jgi:hypothetical protein
MLYTWIQMSLIGYGLEKYVCKNFVIHGEYFVYHILLLRSKGPKLIFPCLRKTLGRPWVFDMFGVKTSGIALVNAVSTASCVLVRSNRNLVRKYSAREHRYCNRSRFMMRKTLK